MDASTRKDGSDWTGVFSAKVSPLARRNARHVERPLLRVHAHEPREGSPTSAPPENATAGPQPARLQRRAYRALGAKSCVGWLDCTVSASSPRMRPAIAVPDRHAAATSRPSSQSPQSPKPFSES